MVTPGQPFDIIDFLRHLALPAMILGFAYAAIFMRYTRSSMLEVIHSDYVTTATSKGLSRRIVISRHAFRNALIPIITILGLSIPEMIGGRRRHRAGLLMAGPRADARPGRERS